MQKEAALKTLFSPPRVGLVGEAQFIALNGEQWAQILVIIFEK